MKPTQFLFTLMMLGFLFTGCQRKVNTSNYEGPLFLGQKIDFQETLTTIAIGSCNRQDLPQEMWPFIEAQNPDLWIWLGDNIYGDSEDMEVMRKKYLKQKFGEAYTSFRSKTPVIGIWDDHDYGVNDGGKEFPMKKETQQLMFDFLDVPKNAKVRAQEGAYQSYTFGPKGKRIKIILLDARYFRDPLQVNPDRNARYFPNKTGDILGEAQWAWLEKELTNSDADIHLIGSGIQFIPEEQIYEKWANFPSARKRFFDLLDKTQPAYPVLLSGDRHISEISRIELDNSSQQVFEFTSSGMTHTWSGPEPKEPNKYRIGNLVAKLSYGILQIDWSGAEPTLDARIMGLENKEWFKTRLK